MLCTTVLETPMKSHVYTYPVKFHAYEIYSWLVNVTFSFCVLPTLTWLIHSRSTNWLNRLGML